MKLVNEWQGKEILFPNEIIFTQMGKDTIDYKISETNYKVLVYIDSIGCTSCKLHLHKWKELIAEIDSVTNGRVPFLFFFHPKKVREIRYFLKRDDFTYPICLDLEDKLNAINHFPSEMSFQTFLLDKENKVVVIGNPVHNVQVKELYLREITGKTSKRELISTQIDQSSYTLNLGNFSWTEKQISEVKIKKPGILF